MSSLGGDGAIKPLADHASDFVPDFFNVFCSRQCLTHCRAVASKNYHLAVPGSNTLAGGANGAPVKARANAGKRECRRGIAALAGIQAHEAGWTVNIGCPI